MPIGQKSLFIPGCVQGAIFKLVCLCMCMCNIVFFTGCEICTRPISTNPGSMDAGEYGLKRVGRVSSQAVSRWSRSAGCCGFRGVFWVRRDFVFFPPVFFLRMRTACCKYEVALPHYLSTSSEARPRERSGRGHFFVPGIGQKSPSK